ncbi:MAG: two-component regulator propeller domain-containing protein [Chryseolinea sp.]
MKTFFQGSFVGLALFFFGRQGLAQTDNLRFEHLSTADGLSNNSLRDICQDRDGFLWFGTLDGLNKYDGYNFTIFKFDPNEPDHSLQNSVPKDIYEDSTGRLWVATLGGGLNEVEKNTGKIIPYGIPPIRTNNWNVLLTIYEERPGILWLGAVPGILRFDLQTKKYTKYPLPIATNVGGMDAAGRLWVISRSGVFYLNSKNGDFTPIPLNAPSGNPSFFTAIHLDAAGVLWVGTDANGLFRLDTKVNPLQLIPYNPKGQINQSLNNYAQGIYEDAEGFLWLATTQGLQRVDKKTNQVVTYRSDPSRPGSLSSNNVHSVFKDREGTLWVGTDNGINKAVARPKLFETHKIIHPPTRVHLAENDIQAILEDRDGTVWLGSPKGLYRMDRSRKHIKPISDAKASERFSREGVEALYEDHLGRLWVGTNQALYQLVTGKENFVRYPTQSPIQFLAEDAKGNLWLGGFLRNSGAIFSFNPVTEKFHYYPAESAPDETVTKNTILGTWRLFLF